MTPGVSIVIPTWNGLELLKQFLPSVIDAARHYTLRSQAPTEILIVDDGSEDPTPDWLLGQGFVQHSGEEERGMRGVLIDGETADAAELRFVRSETNRGFGEACNLGMKAARYPLVLLLNNDVEPEAGAIAPLIENFRDGSVFAAHCRVFDLMTGDECGTGKVGSFARGFIRVHRSYVPAGPNSKQLRDGLPERRPSEFYSMFAGGGSAMFDREKFLDVGGFEPLLSPFYWEDVELSYRAWKRGYTILYEPRSTVRHRLSSTIGRLNRRSVRTIEQRNRLVYHWINLGDWPMLASHVAWVLLLAITAPLRLQPEFVSSCVAALKLLPKIRKRRSEETHEARRTDREVLGLFSLLERREDLFVYDDYAELRAMRDEKP